MAQGVISLKVIENESSVHLKSVESADFNKHYIRGDYKNGINYDKQYEDVGYNLVALACQYSIERDCKGYVYLASKTQTIPFYTDLGGRQFGKSQMIYFYEKAGQNLAEEKFPGGAIQWLK